MPARQPDPISYLELLGEQYGRTLARALAPNLTVQRPAPRRASAAPERKVVPRAAAPRQARPRAVRPVPENKNVVAGALVRYRQGRGTFEAEVIRVDTVSGMATLQRTLDAKRVLRPLDRIYT